MPTPKHCDRPSPHPAHRHLLGRHLYQCPGTTPEPLAEPITARLAEIAALRPGWLDGQGEAITGNTIGIATRLAAALPANLHPLYLYPTEPGGIEIEWRDQHGTHSITVQPDGTLYLLSDDPAVSVVGEQPHAAGTGRPVAPAVSPAVDGTEAEGGEAP